MTAPRLFPLVPPPGMSPGRRRVLIIHNPTAGRRRQAVLAAVVADLEGLGVFCEVRATRCAGDAVAIAAGADRAAHDVVVAAGGDGTVNEVANGLLRASDPPPLAVVPLGTANVLAHELHLPRDPRGLAQVIAGGVERPVHPAVAGGRAFLLMAGAGFDARVVHGVRRPVKRLLGKGAYVLQSLIEALVRRDPLLTVTADGVVHEAHMVVACKARHYGGPHVATPAARLDAPTVEVLLFARRGLVAQARYGLALLRGTLPTLPDVTTVRARRLTVSAGGPVPVQIDGDAGGLLPLTVEPAPRRLFVVVAAAAAAPPANKDVMGASPPEAAA